MKIAGAILAGGNAKRLNGIIKGNIKINKYTTIIRQLFAVFNKAGINNVAISANNPEDYKQYGKSIISDRGKNLGPLAGIEAVLTYFKQYDAVIFLPCDLPNISAYELLELKNAMKTNKKSIIYTMTNKCAHPLCVAISTNKLTAITKTIDSGTRKILSAWQQLNAQTIKFSDDGKFYNINTPADLIALNFHSK